MPRINTQTPAPYAPAVIAAAATMSDCDAYAVVACDAIGETVCPLELQAAYAVIEGNTPPHAERFDYLDAMAYGPALQGLI